VTIWALLSDVHGHLPRLERAVELCRARGADRWAFLGDLLGRGDSDRCVALIRALADVSVVGNRDLDWQHRVAATSRDYVLGLPTAQRGEGFLAVHGDARLERDLCSADERRGFIRSYRRLAREGLRIGLIGHTHRARVWRLSGPDEPPELLHDAAADPRSATVRLDADAPTTRFVVNVGTVGLPFAAKGPPSCAVLDVAGGTVEIIPLGG